VSEHRSEAEERSANQQREPRRIGESLDRVAKRLGAPSSAGLAAVFAGWRDAVGDEVAAHAAPVSLVDGVLVVAVDQPIWRTQLAYLEPELVRRFAAVAGPDVVRAVRVRMRSG
jgi:predicted nucleic acid-binding Zn ribbon protein